MGRLGIAAGRAALIVVTAAVFPPHIFAQGSPADLSNASIENLLNMQVTSVSRRQEELRSTSAAVYVITSEDIRRSGITDIAELFRMVPGMDVAQSNSSVWAVSSRGFNAQYSNKLLVTIDGRSVYDPSFSGVFWNLQNLVLEDIDRIEVIRGPGATMWGSNAVNGVISIKTKKASETKGGLFVADAGEGRPGEGTIRFGQALGKTAFYRASVRQTTRSNLLKSSGGAGGDAWNSTNLDSRLDWNPSSKDSFVMEFGAYRGVAGSTQSLIQSVSPPSTGPAGLIDTNGSHALARWNRTLSSASNLTLQFYYDDNHRVGWAAKGTDSIDFDLQHNFRVGSRQNVMWGFGNREVRNRIDDVPSFGILPGRQSINQWNAFVQDEIPVVKDKLVFTIGSKFERSTLTGSNAQPSLHVLWLATARQSLWFAASRAVRTTNIAERGVHVRLSTFNSGPFPGLVELFGQPDTKSEDLMAFEAGYRYQATRKFWIDLATFYNDYQNLSTTTSGPPTVTFTPTPLVIAPQYFGNQMNGETYGTELAANYRASTFVTFRGGYSLLRMQMHADPGTAHSVESIEGASPRHQVQAGVMVNLPRSFEASSHSYFVSRLPAYLVPSYTRLDSNITWKGLERVELSLIGQNLLGSHLEFGDTPAVSNVVHRSIFGRVAWKF